MSSRSQSLRIHIAMRKKQTKNETNQQQNKSQLQTYIQEQNEIKLIQTSSPLQTPTLIEAVLGETFVKTRIIVQGIKSQMFKFISMINQRLGKQPQYVHKYLSSKQNQGRKIIISIVKALIQMIDSKRESVEVLKNEFKKPNSLLQILACQIDFEEVKFILLQSKHTTYFTSYLVQIFQFHKLQTNISLFSEFERTCKNEESWKNQSFGVDENLEIYTLEHISYNVLHYFANKLNFSKFFEFVAVASSDLINQFNHGNETPIDIGLKMFPLEELDKLFCIVQQNKQILPSLSSLNHLLQNKNLALQPLNLLKYIKIIKGLQKRGYIDQLKLKTGDCDTVEYYQSKLLLTKLDKHKKFPLLKYFTFFKNHNLQIVEELFPNELKKLNKVYDRKLKLNLKCQEFRYPDFYKQVNFQELRDKQQDYIDLYVKQLIEESFKCCEQQIVLYVFKQTNIGNFFTNFMSKGADFVDHILVKIINKTGFKKMAEYLIDVIFKNPQVLSIHNQAIKQQTDRNNNQQPTEPQDKDRNLNVINQLYCSYVEIQHTQNAQNHNLIKQKFRKYYTSNPEKCLEFIIRDRNKKYVVNRLFHCFKSQQIIKLILPLRQKLAYAIVLDPIQAQSQLWSLLSHEELFSVFKDVFNLLCFQNNETEDLRIFYRKNCQKKRWSFLTQIFILHHKKPHILNHYIQHMRSLQTCKLDCDMLFKAKNLDQNIIQKLVQSEFSYQLTLQAYHGLDKQNNQICKKVLKYRNSKSYCGVAKFREVSKFKSQYQDYKRLAIDFKFQVLNKQSLLKEIREMKVDQFQKEALERMINDSSTFFASVLKSDDSQLQKVKKFIDNNRAILRFFQIIKSLKQRTTTQDLFVIQNDKCNYLIIKYLQQRLSEVKDNIFPQYYLKFKTDENKIFKSLSCVSNDVARNSMFQKIIPYMNNGEFQKPIQQQEKATQLNSEREDLIKLIPKLNEQSISLIKIQFFSSISKMPDNLIHLLEKIVGIVSNSKIAEIIQKAYNIDEDNLINKQQYQGLNSKQKAKKTQQYIQPEIKLLRKIIQKQTDGSSYKRILRKIKTFLHSQMYQSLDFICLKQLAVCHPKLAYDIILSDFKELKQKYNLNELFDTIRFKGDAQLIFLLVFVLEIKQSTIVLMQNKTAHKYKFSSSIALFLSLDHFKQYFNVALKIVSLYSDYKSSLLSICMDISKNNAYDKLVFALNAIKQPELIVNVIDNIYKEIKYKQTSEDTKRCLNFAYSKMKQVRKSIDNFEQLKNIYRHKQQVLLDYPHLKIDLCQFIELMGINSGSKALQNYQKNVQKSNENQDIQYDNSSFNETFRIRKSLIKDIHPLKLQRDMSSHVTLNNLKFVQTNANSQLRYWPVIKNINNMILDLIQSNKDISKYYVPKQFSLSKRLLNSRNIKSFQNYFALQQNFLDQKDNRIYLLKFGTRQLVNKYLTFYKPQDLKSMIIYCNDLEIFKRFSISFSKEQIRSAFIEHFYPFIYRSQEHFIIKVFDQFDLYSQALEYSFKKRGFYTSEQEYIQPKQGTIFQVIMAKRLFKLFNKMLEWASKSGTDIKSHLQSSLSDAQLENFYEYKYIPAEISNLPSQVKFSSSMRFYRDQQIMNSIQSVPFLSQFITKLKNLLSIRKILFSKQNSIISTPMYTFDLHHLLLNIALDLNTQDLQNRNLKNFQTYTQKFLLAIKFLKYHQITKKEVKQLKYPLLLILMLYCYTSNKQTLSRLKKQYSHEFNTCEALCEIFGKTINFPNNQKLSFVSFFLNQSIVLESNLVQFIFKNYPKQIGDELSTDILLQYNQYIFHLLPQFNQQPYYSLDQHSVYSKALPQIKDYYRMKYGQILILNWCCFDKLQLPLNQLFEELNFQHLSSIAVLLKHVEDNLEQQSEKNEANAKDCQMLVQTIFNQFESKISVSKEVLASLVSSLIPIKLKCYYNLSIINLYITLNTIKIQTQKQFQESSLNIKIILSPNSQIQYEQDSIKIYSKTEIVTNKISSISSDIFFDISTISNKIQNKLWITFNTTYLQQKIDETIATIIQNASKARMDQFNNLELTIDFDSFQKIDNKSEKQRVFFSESVSRSNILSLKEIFDDIIYSIRIDGLYETDDISAPGYQSDAVLIEYYRLLFLPKKPIELKYLNKEEMEILKQKQNQFVLTALTDYYNYFVAVQKQKDASAYQFSYQINYNIDEKNIRVNTSLFSFYQIVKFFDILNKFEQQILSQVKGLTIKLNVLNILQFFKTFKTSKTNLLQIVSKFIFNKNFSRLVNFICLSVLSTMPNISSSIIGLRFNFKLVSEQKGGYTILNNPNWKICKLTYESTDPIIDVTIQTSVTGVTGTLKFQEPALNQELKALFDCKQFVDCVFSTPQKLTNYYVNRNTLDNQIVGLSKNLTDQFDKMINISIDYKSLYEIVKNMTSKEIPHIQHTLTQLSSKLVSNIKSRIQENSYSDNTVNYYNILLHQKAYEINNRQHYSTNPQQLIYNPKATPYLTRVLNLKSKFDEKIANTYLIQIYKSYFLNTLVLKNNYVLGMKDNSLTHLIVNNNNVLQNIDYNNVKWILMVSKTIPDESILPKEKIIRIAVCDLISNVYLIDNLKEYVLSNSLSIFELIPIYSGQYNVIFTEKGKSNNCQPDTIQCYFDQNYYSKVKGIKRLPILPSDQLRGILQPKIHTFLKNLDVKIGIRVSFDNKDNIIDVEHFEKVFELYLSIFQKAIEQYLFDVKEFYIIEIASLVFPESNLKEGYLKLRKRQLLEKYLKQIHLRIGKQDDNKVTINQKELRVYINSNSDKTVKIDHNMILERFNSWVYQHETQRLNLKLQNIAKSNFSSDLLVLYELQSKTVDFVKRIYPKYQYKINVSMEGKKELKFEGNVVQLTINESKIFSFDQIVACILKLQQPNYHLVQYKEGIIQLNAQLHYVSEVIIVPLDSKKQVLKQNLKLQNVTEIKIKVPQDSIYIVIGQSVYWNKTSSKINFEKDIKGNQGQQIKIFMDVKTKQKVITDVTKCTFTYKNPNVIHSLLDLVSSLRLPTRNIVQFTTKADLKCRSIIVCPPKPQFPHNSISNQPITLKIQSSQGCFIPNTKFVSISFPNKNNRVTIKNIEKQYQDQFKQPISVSKHDASLLSHQQLEEVTKEEIGNQRPLNIIKSEYKHLSTAGQQRVDTIVLCNAEGSEIGCDHSNLKIYFQYTENWRIKIIPKIKVSDFQLNLSWTPTLRGRYNLVIDGIIVPHNHEIAVIAAEIDTQKIKLSLPKQTVANYCEEVEFSCEYKDIYGNTFGELEQTINPEAILLEVESPDTSNLKYKVKKINKNSVQMGYFMDHNMSSDQKKAIRVQFMFMKQLIQQLTITVNGLPLKKRQDFFNKQLDKVNKKRYRTINIKRQSFLQNLLNISQDDLNAVYSVTFVNEPGIDAGGLKRQFYDMIGSVFKNQKYQFFKPILKSKARYAFHPNILKNKKKYVFLRCFGKFLANSILNGYFIGVDFSETFVKALYKVPMNFEDLKQVLEPSVFERYQYLRQLPKQDFEDMYLTFNLIEGSEEVELVENGKNIPVTKDNVEEYLSQIAQYQLYKRYSKCYQAFFNGFEEVFPFKLIEKSFKPNEFYILTCGLHEITPQIVLDILVFPNEASLQIGWFKRYISQASQEILQKFLKFTTGSSSLPYDVTTTRLSIEFYKLGSNPQKLPISHTCYKSIEIPTYSSYEILEKKLNIAFLYASEGFGFG